jgi:hypothetical protein
MELCGWQFTSPYFALPELLKTAPAMDGQESARDIGSLWSALHKINQAPHASVIEQPERIHRGVVGGLGNGQSKGNET